MRLAFIPTAYRTPIFLGIARELERRGHEVVWLSPNRRWARWLEHREVSNEVVLDITRWASEWTDGADLSREHLERLTELEHGGSLRARNIVQMDPLLRRRPTDYALRYLAVCAREVQRFLHRHQVEIVFGEQTWAFELLVGQVARSFRIDHLMPHTVRIPSQRFGFFLGPRERELVALAIPDDEHLEEARRFLDQFRRRKPRPDYMSIDRSVLRPDPQRLRTLGRHVLDLADDPYDETSRRPLGLIADHCLQVLRRWRNLRSSHLSSPDPHDSPPFVYFPLHMQPEASLDIKGAPFTSQIEIVRAMARTLPVTHRLFVKEHGIALTRRDLNFYSSLAEIPGVRLIHPAADSMLLLQKASLTVTITGTAAYEAALLGWRAATIAPIFFDPIVELPRFDPFRQELGEILGSDPPRVDDDRLVGFLAHVLANSYPGIVGDAFWQPDTLRQEMIERVSDGFEALLSKRAARSDATAR